MYERFTDRCRKVLQLANQEAQRFNHEYVGTEHLLLGIVKERHNVAAIMLNNLGIDLHRIRLEVEKKVQNGAGSAIVMGRLPHTPRATNVLKSAIEISEHRGQNYVGTEHMLLALLKEKEGMAYDVLKELGVMEEWFSNMATSLPPDPQLEELYKSKEKAVVNQDFESAIELMTKISEHLRGKVMKPKEQGGLDQDRETLKKIETALYLYRWWGRDETDTIAAIRIALGITV